MKKPHRKEDWATHEKSGQKIYLPNYRKQHKLGEYQNEQLSEEKTEQRKTEDLQDVEKKKV